MLAIAAVWLLPVAAGHLQQGEAPLDVAAVEGEGILYSAVDVGLRGKVHHVVGAVLGKELVHGALVADVRVHEGMARVVCKVCDVGEHARMQEGIDVDHLGVRIGPQQVVDEVRADEARAPGYQITSHVGPPFACRSR